MTEEEKAQIRFLREKGYTYGKIAKILCLKRSTISSYCLRHHIRTANVEGLNKEANTEYRSCLRCNQLFLAQATSKQQFCSTDCRRRYWKNAEIEANALEEEGLQIKTLRKELDLFAEESDELVGEEAIHLCRKEETTM